MLRLSEQILFLMKWGEVYFPELGEVVERPYDYSLLLPKSNRAVRRTLTRLVRRGEIVRQGKRARAKYGLTNKGEVRLLEVRPWLARLRPDGHRDYDRAQPTSARGYGEVKWDGKWRMVVFDIPERYRGMRGVLRRFLSQMGLINFQRSLWLTPFAVGQEVRTFIEASRLSEMALLVETEEIYGMEPAELAFRAWRLGDLTQKYEALALECERSERVTLQHRRMLTSLMLSDPLLPKELLPKDFPRGEAMREYGDLIRRSNPDA